MSIVQTVDNYLDKAQRTLDSKLVTFFREHGAKASDLPKQGPLASFSDSAEKVAENSTTLANSILQLHRDYLALPKGTEGRANEKVGAIYGGLTEFMSNIPGIVLDELTHHSNVLPGFGKGMKQVSQKTKELMGMIKTYLSGL